MKSPFFYILLGIILCTTSCNNESISEITQEFKIPVRFEISLQQDIIPFPATKNIPGGKPGEPSSENNSSQENNPPSDGENGNNSETTTNVSYIEYAVYENSTSKLVHYLRHNISNKSGNLLIEDKLPTGVYKICFLAHNVSEAQFNENNNIVSFPKVDDTFWQFLELEISATPSVNKISRNIQLNRIVAGIEFVATDIIPQNANTFNITTSGIYNKIDLLTGLTPKEKQDFSTTYTFKDEDKKTGSKVKHFFYSFVPTESPKDAQSVIESVSIKTNNVDGVIIREHNITNIPIRKNRITRYTGNLYTPNEGNINLNYSIDTSWEQENEITLN